MRSIIFEKGLTLFNLKVRPWYIPDVERYFLASGSEGAWRHLTNDGFLRVDGKLLCGKITNNGVIKVEGSIEFEPYLE